LLEALGGLRHRDGRPLVQVFGPTGTAARGGTVTFTLRDRDGRPVEDQRVEELANRAGISLRTGCFCNPGAGEIAHGLGPAELARWFAPGERRSFPELRAQLHREHGILVGAVRVSVGLATNFADVFRFLCFLQGFVDRSVDELARPDFDPVAPGREMA
jgi:selenocysteine lyase/cysteine desulfurase